MKHKSIHCWLMICVICVLSIKGMERFNAFSTNAYSLASRTWQKFQKWLDNDGQSQPEAQAFIVDYNPADFSQTEFQLFSHKDVATSNFVTRFMDVLELKEAYEQLVKKERALDKNYYTFIHAQRKGYYWPEKLYTMLWSMRYRKPVHDFLFAHVKPPLEPDDMDEFMERDTHRVLLLNNEGKFSDKESVYKHVLFMNYALFANDSWRGNNSAYLLSTNYNWNHAGVNLVPYDAFRLLGYKDIYDQFATEVQEIDQEYRNLSKYGNLLLIAIPKADIAEYVYPANDDGTKKSVEIVGVGQTNDIKLVMETLLHDPEKISDADLLQFAMIMFHKFGGLDPDTGIKIIPIIAGDPKKLEQLQKKENELFKKIKSAIEEKNNKALARARILLRHLQPTKHNGGNGEG